MNLTEYQKLSRTTASYPVDCVTYPILGLCGEIGESYEKILTSHNSDEIHKELGDVMWYIAQITTEIKEDLQTLFNLSISTNTLGTDYEFIRDRDMCIIYASKIAEVGKKIIRDNDGILDDDRKTRIKTNLIPLIYHFNKWISMQHGNMEDVCQINIDKLFSRKERGAIQGDGDNR